MITHKRIILPDGRLVRVVSGSTQRGFNVASIPLIKAGFSVLPEVLPETYFEFETMVPEERAMDRYCSIVYKNLRRGGR